MTENQPVSVNQYFEYLKEGKVMGSACPQCQNIDLPPRRICSKCQHETHWKALSLKANLSAFTAINVGTPIMNQKGYDRKHPYIFAVGKLEDGPMISGLMQNAVELENNPSEIKIGMPLNITFIQTQIGTLKDGNPKYRWDIGFEPR